jgi:RHS repeat-associated protein
LVAKIIPEEEGGIETWAPTCAGGTYNPATDMCEEVVQSRYEATENIVGGVTYDKPIYKIAGDLKDLLVENPFSGSSLFGYVSSTSFTGCLEISQKSYLYNYIYSSRGGDTPYGYINETSFSEAKAVYEVTDDLAGQQKYAISAVSKPTLSGFNTTLLGYVASTPATYGGTVQYTCPDGGTLDGTTCIVDTIVQTAPDCGSGTLDGENDVCRSGTGQAVAEEVYFYHTDVAGTPLAMSDSSMQKVWEADYKPFGEEFTVEANHENDKRFVGKEKDGETGLNYFGARYLSAKTGRFLAPDPVRAVGLGRGKVNASLLAEPQRLNTYAYSMNNPYRFIDQNGLDPYPILDVVVSQGFQGGFTFKIAGVVGLELSANLGRTETSLHGGDAVSQSFTVALDLGKVSIGLDAERKAPGHPIPTQKDLTGRVIPYTGRSIINMLRGKKWAILPVISAGRASANIGADDWTLEGGIIYPLLPCIEGSVNLSEINRRIDKANSEKPRTRIPLNGAL